MKKTNNIIINDLTEDDMISIFNEAMYDLGMGGKLIPPDMINLREKVIEILFNNKDKV